jgi:hypothetical protein
MKPIILSKNVNFFFFAAIVGNAANQLFPTEAYWDEVYKVKNAYTELAYNYYGTIFPFWDETAMFSILDPANVLNSTQCTLLIPVRPLIFSPFLSVRAL